MKARPLAVLVPAILLAGVSLAIAQHPPPPPTRSLPPAPAALSVPNPLAGLRPGPRDLYRSPDGSDRFQHISHHPPPPPVVFPGVYYPWPIYYQSQDMRMDETHPLPRHEIMARGGLVLQTLPEMAQVFVDGYYVGLAEEFGLQGRVMDVSAGAHRVELRANGYETLAFTVMIEPNDILRYRGDLQLVRTPKPTVPAGASSPATSRSFYVIPNCYAGDKPPSGTLPKGCDPKKLQTRK